MLKSILCAIALIVTACAFTGCAARRTHFEPKVHREMSSGYRGKDGKFVPGPIPQTSPQPTFNLKKAPDNPGKKKGR